MLLSNQKGIVLIGTEGWGALMHYIYIVECADNSLYTGYARDIEKRIKEHNASEKGAKYTRTRRPVSLRYFEVFETRSEACKREYAIKKMSRKRKEELLWEQPSLEEKKISVNKKESK